MNRNSSETVINYELHQGLVPRTTFFIHGNLASNRWWHPTLEIIRQGNEKNQPGSLIFAEFRGCGQSSAPNSEAEVDMNLFADDFIQLIQGLSLGEPINLVGHSTGGLIAALMMSKEPGLFHKAVLLDPVGSRGVTFDSSMIGAFEQMKVDKGLTAAVIGSTIYQNDSSSKFFNDVIVEDAFSAVKTVGHLVLKALDGLNSVEQIKNVSQEVLVLHGEHDFLLPVADSQEMAQLMINGRFEVMAGQGHCGNIENPQAFVSLITKFLY